MRKSLLFVAAALLVLITLAGGAVPSGSATSGVAIPPTPAVAPSRPPPMPTVPPPPGFSVIDAGNPNVGYGATMALLDDNSRALGVGFTRVMYTLGWDT